MVSMKSTSPSQMLLMRIPKDGSFHTADSEWRPLELGTVQTIWRFVAALDSLIYLKIKFIPSVQIDPGNISKALLLHGEERERVALND